MILPTALDARAMRLANLLVCAWVLTARVLGAALPGLEQVYYLGRSNHDPLAEHPLVAGTVYDGSNADRVDEFMRNVPENSTIRFGKGVFQTRGLWDNWLSHQEKGFRLKQGWTLIGAGTNTVTGTVLQLVDVPVDKSFHYNYNVVLSTGGIGLYDDQEPAYRRPNIDRVTIQDLQIDCNYPAIAASKGTPALLLAGIQILGNRGIKVVNVLVRNAASKHAKEFECFQVYVYNRWATNGPGDYLFDRVAIGDFHGGYTSAICVNGNATGSVQNCTVDLASDSAQRYAINFAAGIHHFTIANNTMLNATRALNNDTSPVCTDVLIISNRVINCRTGFFLANSRSNRVVRNVLNLAGGGAGIAIESHPTLEHVTSGSCVVQGNVLNGPSGEGISLGYINEFNLTDATFYWSSNNFIQNNVFSPALQNKLPPFSIAPNILRPGNRRHDLSYPPCSNGGQPGNLAPIGFPSEIGLGSGCAYCIAKALDSRDGFIARMRLMGTQLDMRSDGGDGTGYTDFTTGYALGTGRQKRKGSFFVQWADMRRGGVYRLEIGTGGVRNAQRAFIRVYIDLDHDGVFDATHELVASSEGKGSFESNVFIPASAALGSTRMRVMLSIGKPSGPCDFNRATGEVQDYTVSIVP